MLRRSSTFARRFSLGGLRSSVFARRGGWSRPLPLGAPRPCFYPPFSLLEARAALQAKATRLRRFFNTANGAYPTR